MGSAGSKTPRATSKEGRSAGAVFDSVELHVIKLTYKDLAGLSKSDKRGEAIDKATFLQNFPVPGLVGGQRSSGRVLKYVPVCPEMNSTIGLPNGERKEEPLALGTLVSCMIPRLTSRAMRSYARSYKGVPGDRLFHALDAKGLGRISFDDFVVGLAVCCRGTLEEKMRFIFGVYDMDGDGLISRDELQLMLNQVPRTLLNIGGASASNHTYHPEVNGIRPAPVPEPGSGLGRSHQPLITPRHSGNITGLAHSFRSEDAVPPPAPASSGRKRVPSLERPSRRRAIGTVSKSYTAAVLEEFTNESVADQALRDFGSEDESHLMFDQFERWAQQTPAVQALLQGAFPTDAHFSLATSPRARRASCESLVNESPRRSSFGGSSTTASGAAATAVAAVVGWSASRPSSRQGTPRNGSLPPGSDSISGTGLTPSGSGRSFFASGEALTRTPSRGHSRNTSYDNLLRSPIVGSGVLTSDSPVLRRRSVPTARGGGTPFRGAGTPARGVVNPSSRGGTPVRGSGTPASRGGTPVRDDSRGDALAPIASTAGPAQVATSGDSGGPKSTGNQDSGGDNKSSTQSVWRWGEGADAIVSTEPRSLRSRIGRRPPQTDSAGSALLSSNGGELRHDCEIPTPRTVDRARRKLHVPAPSPQKSLAPLPSPASSRVQTNRRRGGQAGGDDAVAPAGASGGSSIASSGGMDGEPGGKTTPLPPLGGKQGGLLLDNRELTGKARKLARIAQAAGTVGVSPAMSCQDLLALSFTGDCPAPSHDGVLRASGDGKPKRRSGGHRPNLRISRSFSHIDDTRHRNKLESPSVAKRGIVAKVRGITTPQHLVGRGRGTPTPASSRRAGDRGMRSKRASLKGSMSGASSGAESGGESDANGSVTASVNGTPARSGDMLATELSLGVPAQKVVNGNGIINGNAGGGGGPAIPLNSAVGAEAVVRDTLYNSHGIVALDGYLWKPGAIRIVRRWMMLVDNSLYYFVRPGDRKPRGVISLPGCVAEAVTDEDVKAYNEAALASTGGGGGGSGSGIGSGSGFGVGGSGTGGGGPTSSSQIRRESRKHRVPPGFYGIRLLRPNNHGKHSSCRLFLAKTISERDEWVAELRVASRVVPLDEHFELKALLRKGAFASVHRGVHKETGKDYAIKVIDKTSLSSHEKSLLRGEIGALKLVSHPNVVRLEAVHEDPRSISIVMTLCRGGDLWDKVRSQPSRCFNTTQARTVMRPLCEAVLYLHDLGILHRDIKPENILLVHNSTGNDNLSGVILSDFGFSHQVSPKSRLACGKQLMGTPSYMAPESILHGMYGKEVDWFACGCVLYMMLMGRAPFGGATPSEIFRNTCNGRLGLGRGGASLWDRLPADARDLIVGLMQLDHNLRLTGEQALRHSWLLGDDDLAEKRSSRRQTREELLAATDKRHRHCQRVVSGINGDHLSLDGGETPTTCTASGSTSCASSASSAGVGLGLGLGREGPADRRVA